MADETTTPTTQQNTEWYNDPNIQNLGALLLQYYQNNAARDDATQVTGDILSQIQGMGSVGGMDFSAFTPLLGVIKDTSYSRNNAIADSQGFIAQIFKDYENSSLPKIYANPRATGVYNDTSTQLLANDAFSSAVAKGQAQLVQNILAYAQARSAQLSPVMQLMNGMVSNSNAQISAEAQRAQQLINALQGHGTATAVADGSQRQDNIALLGALLNAGTSWYNNYQQQQQNPYGNSDNTQSNEVTLSDGSTFSN